MAALRCGTWASYCSGYTCGAWALTTWASVVAACGLSSCSSRALLLHIMWDLPRSGIEPVSPELAGLFLTIRPPEKARYSYSFFSFFFLLVGG